MTAVGKWLTLVAVLDSCCRESGERGSTGVGGASDIPLNKSVNHFLYYLCTRGKNEVMERSYGPISEGVTGSDGGGGKLIRVGVVMVMKRCQDEDND